MSVSQWPKDRSYRDRFLVRDLIPGGGKKGGPSVLFVGESPHRDEVAPESADERSPFRGMAGRNWWKALSAFLPEHSAAGKKAESKPENKPDSKKVPPRKELESLCQSLRIGVLNAVQFPLDPKITLHQGEPSAPFVHLGFDKSATDRGYKRVLKSGGEKGPVGLALQNLATRLKGAWKPGTRIVCLGNDSRWFVEQALKPAGLEGKVDLLTIPHPSAWWRNANFKIRAQETLSQVLEH